jgi:hypothetical protein
MMDMSVILKNGQLFMELKKWGKVNGFIDYLRLLAQ